MRTKNASQNRVITKHPHITEKHIRHAKVVFAPPLETLDADEALRLRQTIRLKNARQASMISVGEMARRMSISHQTYSKLERRIDGATLRSLKKAAEALNCDFIYFFQPRETKTFLDRLREPALEAAMTSKNAQRGWPVTRGIVLGNTATAAIYHNGWRRQQGWGKVPQRERQSSKLWFPPGAKPYTSRKPRH